MIPDLPGNGQEPRVGDHAVIGPDAPGGDVPRAVEHLEGFEVVVAGLLELEDELLHLDGRGQVPADDPPVHQDPGDRRQRGPGFGEVQDRPVEGLPGLRRQGYVCGRAYRAGEGRRLDRAKQVQELSNLRVGFGVRPIRPDDVVSAPHLLFKR